MQRCEPDRHPLDGNIWGRCPNVDGGVGDEMANEIVGQVVKCLRKFWWFSEGRMDTCGVVSWMRRDWKISEGTSANLVVVQIHPII